MHLTLSGTVVTAAQVRRCKNPNVAKKVKTRLLQYLVARIPNVPHLPRETKVDVSKCHACHVSKCHACHAKCSYMSPSATPATQKAAASTATCGNRARHQSQPSAIRATPATWNEGGCLKVPRLPHKVKVDVSKCHACHAKCSYMSPSATPATQKAAASTATCGNRVRHQSQPSATQSDDPCRQEQVVWWNCSQVVCPSTTPATWNEGGCHQVPRLPRKVTIHVMKCHACHANSRGEVKVDVTKLPRLPHKVKVDVTKCHACHTNCVQVVCEYISCVCVSKLCVCVQVVCE